jgi:predicted  nucleic acid-binding Zn-ribbon protein
LTEIEKKKEYLRSYRKKYSKLKSLQEQMQSLNELSKSAKAQSISDMPKGNMQTDLSDIMVRQEELFTKITRLQSECQEIMLNIENGIADMQDGIESTKITELNATCITKAAKLFIDTLERKATYSIYSTCQASIRYSDNHSIMSDFVVIEA